MAMKFRLLSGIHQYPIFEADKKTGIRGPAIGKDGEVKSGILKPGEEIISDMDLVEKFPNKFMRVQDEPVNPKEPVSTVRNPVMASKT